MVLTEPWKYNDEVNVWSLAVKGMKLLNTIYFVQYKWQQRFTFQSC